MVSQNSVNIGSGNVLLRDGTPPLLEPIYNTDLLCTGPSGINLTKSLIKIQTFSFQ